MKRKVTLLTLAFLLIFPTLVTSSSEFLNLKWNYSVGQTINGISVEDFNADGRKEIAAITSRGGEIFFINSSGGREWRSGVFCPVYTVGSVNFDGQKILVGACTHLHFFNYLGEKVGQYFTSHAPARIVFPVDLEDDGKPELLIGAGDPASSRKNNLYLINKDKETLWAKGLPLAPYSIDVKDINADGLKEIVVGCRSLGTRSGYSGGKITVYDAEGNLEWQISTAKGIYQVKIEDIDRDGNFEIVAGSLYKVYVFNKDGEEEWSYETGGTTYSLDVIDVKGKRKVVVGSDKLMVFNSDLKLDWKYDTEDEIYTLTTGDLNKDGIPEIFAGANRLYIFSHDGKLLWKSDSFISVRGLSFTDLEGDGYEEIIVGSADEMVYAFETKQYVIKEKAEETLKNAQKLYKDKEYEKALSSALEAQGFYQDLGQEAKVKECHDLILEINATFSENLRNREEAKEYWDKSVAAYTEDDYQSALAFARKAKLYLETVENKEPADREALEKYNSLINNSILALKLVADSYYQNASSLHDSRRYIQAFSAIQEANWIYEWINSSITNESNELMAKISYSLAEKEFRENKLENASLHVQRALELYLKLGNETHQKDIRKCENLQKKIAQGPQSLLQKIEENSVLILGVGIIILLILIIKVGRPLLKREKEPEEKEPALKTPPQGPSAKKEETNHAKVVREVKKAEPEKKPKPQPKKPKFPELESITKDKFKGTGRSLRV